MPDPLDLRATVAARLAALDLSPYTAARQTAGAVTGEQLSRYVRGERDLTGTSLGAVLAALGLTVSEGRPKKVPKKTVPVS